MKKPAITPEAPVTRSAIHPLQSSLADSCINSQNSPAIKPKSNSTNGSKTYISVDLDSLSASSFVRLPTLLVLFGCSRASIWRWVRAKRIPAPRKIGPRLVAWNVSELRQAISAFMKGESQ